MEKFPPSEYNLPFFKELGYTRRHCPKCGKYYWTSDPQQKTCGEATSDGCACYGFINNSPTKKKFSLGEMRECFLAYFERQGHTRIEPYPVVARWRDDIYFTHASIIDFQPYVTDGITPPPANPLVISQPCIRMVDIANTGPTFGRHMTIFEMGGAHAFNYPDREVYWKDQTVRYHHDWVTKDLGVKSGEIVYKEEVWSGGGNAGPCVESIIRGLEVATLVFMQYKVIGGKFIKLPIRTVDTGYGIDRYAWLSQGALSGFHAIYGELLDKIFQMAGLEKTDDKLLAKVARASGLVSLDKTANRLETRKKEARLVGISVKELDRFVTPIENAFAVADHTKSLCFVLSEGVVPSNIQEGYLARLLFRRIYRLLRILEIPDELYNIVNMQISLWSNDFPQLKEMQDEIVEMLKVEEEKFEDTIKRGEGMVKRIADELKAKKKKEIPIATLTELYDSHGLPPEIVKQTAESKDLKVEIPDNFYALIAGRHVEASKSMEEAEAKHEDWLKNAVATLPETKPLYYQDQYLQEFEAKVLKTIDKQYVVLNQTCFYPEGGGQPADTGYLMHGKSKIEVVDVQKVGKVIVHKLKIDGIPKEGSTVKGVIDWDKRCSLMKNHTATHVIGGAARRVLGPHVWQFGTQKGVESSRLDISHYRRLSLEEIHRIETLANEAIFRKIPVETEWLPRNEAEKRYGFRLYQGGAVPGKEIRVVRAGDWDVEACAGTHLRNTSELGFIKITHTERVQDGVERLTYSVGIPAVKAVQTQEQLLLKVSETLNAPLEKLDKTAEKLVMELKDANAEKRKLIREIAIQDSERTQEKADIMKIKEIAGVKLATRNFGEDIDVTRMVQTANEIVKKDDGIITVFYGSDGQTARIIAMAGGTAIGRGIDTGSMLKEVSGIIGGGGGGKPNFAQAGGTKVDKLPEAIEKVEEIVRKQAKTKIRIRT